MISEIIERDEETKRAVKERQETYKSMDLGQLAEELVQIKLMRKFFDELESSWKDNDVIAKRLAREKMDEIGIDEYTVDDQAKIKKKLLIKGKIEDGVKFFKWLREKGEESLGKLFVAPHLVPEEMIEAMDNSDPDSVKLQVHHQTLGSFLSDQCDVLEPKTWPDGVEVKADSTVYVSLKKGK